MIRVLVFGMTENPGGVESFLMNYYRHLDRGMIQFDFLCNTHRHVAYEDELVSLGARMFHITSRRENRSRFYRELDSIFKEHAEEWHAIWVNVCSLANIDYLKTAGDYGIKKRIIHSHNAENMDGYARGILHRINRRRIGKYATDFWACSKSAAEWFYDETLMQKAVMIHNAIDVREYSFDERNRYEIRKALNISGNTYVIGNVGRFHFQKNQKFIIDIFNEYLKSDDDAALILIGQGEDEAQLRQQCGELGISEKVIFPGVQENIGTWLSAFDFFLFPSRFEGLGIVALEAQANGVPVLASATKVPEEVKINDSFQFYDLQKSPKEWADEVQRMRNAFQRTGSQNAEDRFSEKGYNILEESKKVCELLLR